MSSYQNRPGVWAVWSYGDNGPSVRQVFIDVVPAVREAETYEQVMFWPFEMNLGDAIEWWGKRDPLEDSIIHFFYITTFKIPFCEDEVSAEWVQFDHTAIGKICPDCQDKIGRKIQ